MYNPCKCNSLLLTYLRRFMAKLYKDKIKSDKAMLSWAKDALDQNTYRLVNASHKRYRFFQILLPSIYLIAVMVLCIPFQKYALHISFAGAASFVLIFALWTILARRIFAKTWIQFTRLYQSNTRPKKIIEELNGSKK